MSNRLQQLHAAGVSIWLDYIDRTMLFNGDLERRIRDDALTGMTSNPTIFEKAIAGSQLYDDDIRRLSEQGRSAGEIFETLAVADVQAACDEFRGVYQQTGGRDGFVSIEVSPRAANNAEATIEEAHRLWKTVDRPNVMIKVPGTEPGAVAVRRLTADGVNVNITLLFSIDAYRSVIEGYFAGLEDRLTAGKPIHGIASVASFFVSRVDGKVDPLLDGLGDPKGLRGRIAIANACTAYRFEWALGQPRWRRLAEAGARPQRPLWASTSTKDPRYPDAYYVEALVAPRTVNTLPPETFAAYRDHGHPAPRIQDGIAVAPERLKALAAAGIDLAAVTRELEDDGVAKFAASYTAVLATIEHKAGALALAQGR